MANRLKATTTTGSDVSFPSGFTQTFQAEPFMKKYKKRFLACLKPFSIAASLKVYDLVLEDLYIEMNERRITEREARAKLFLYLCSHADAEMIHNLCDILTDQTTYPPMKKLGEDMKKDNDLPPSSDLSPSSEFPPSSVLTPSSDLPPSSNLPPSSDLPPSGDLPPSSCPPQSRTVVTSTTAEPTPSLSTSDDERTRKLKEACNRLKPFFSKIAETGVKSRYAQNISFIKLAAVERDDYQAKLKKDAGKFLQAVIHGIDGYCACSKMIKYEKILTCSGQKSGKRVVIAGAPGCGKTTLSRQLCKDIYFQALPNAYQLVILVELRRLRLCWDPSAKKDIDLPFLLQRLNLPELCPVIEEQAGTGVLLILDGFDEVADWLGKSPFLSRLLSYEDLYLSECDVFITTRPSRYSDLKSMIETPPFLIEILGFTSNNINSFVKSYFNSDLGKAEEVIHRLKTLPLVRGMCRTPRILEIVCMVQEYPDDDPLPENLSGIFLKYICHQLEEYLSETHPSVKERIRNLLEVPEDLFPGFYQLCEVAYKCCLNQRLILTDEDLGDLKKYADTRGSIYNLLISEPFDDRCPITGVLYQFPHKTVQEALGAVHIGHQSKEDQKSIWMERFGVREMAEIWRMYCGLTKLEHVDLVSLSASLSPPSIDKLDLNFIPKVSSMWVPRQNETKLAIFPNSVNERKLSIQYPDNDAGRLVMMSLYEAQDKSVSNQVLRAVFKNIIRAKIRYPYDSHISEYAISQHPSLQKVYLEYEDNSKLSKIKSDLKPLHESIRNLKAVELREPLMEAVLSALLGQVEELRLTVNMKMGLVEDEGDYWKKTSDALKGNHCLKSLHIYCSSRHWSSGRQLYEMIESLCRNERLTELTIDADLVDLTGVVIDVNSLKSLLVPRLKCSVGLSLTRQQWRAVLSGLKDVKKLKELCVYMRTPWGNPISGTGYDQSNECLISSAEIEKLLATNEQLVKVDVGCDVQRLKDLGDLVLAMVEGICRNKNVSEFRITFWAYLLEDYRRSTRSVLVSLVEALAHTDHITCVRFEYFLFPISTVLGGKWCDLLVTGPMSRPICHLRLELTPAECGLLLSRVHNAEQLEELSLTVGKILNESHESTRNVQVVDEQAVDVQAVEGALSKCRLRNLRIRVASTVKTNNNTNTITDAHDWHCDMPSSQLYPLCCALLRGIDANCNDVDFALHGLNLNEDCIKSQLPQQCWERFEVTKRWEWIHIKLKPHIPAGSVQRSLTTEKSTSEVEASSDKVSTASKKMSPPLSPSREDQPHPISQPSSPVLTSAHKSPEHTEPMSSSSLSTGRDPTSHPLQEDVVKDVLSSSYSYLRKNLSIDNDVASKLFGWRPQLLGDPPYREIISLNERGKHFDAFERWYQFAESSYTEDRLKVFCECLEEIGSPARPKLVDVGRRVLEMLLGGESMSETTKKKLVQPLVPLQTKSTPSPKSQLANTSTSLQMQVKKKKKRSTPLPTSKGMRSPMSSKLSSTSPSPLSTSKARKTGISSVSKKESTKPGVNVPPSTPQQASQESSSVEDAITDSSDLLPYMEDLLPHLTLLGTVLGVGKYTSAVMEDAGSPQTKCIKILSYWLQTTPNPTWRRFCQKLKKAKEFNNLRCSVERKHLQT